MYSVSVFLILLILSLFSIVFILLIGKLSAPVSIQREINIINTKENNSNKIINLQPKHNYFIIALLFIIYCAETLLLFPFALAFGKLFSFVFLQAIVFILIMVLSLSYALRKNLLRLK